MKRLVIALLVSQVCFLAAVAQNHSRKFYCPPCNCTKDGMIFDKPGVCPDPRCSMDLLPVEGKYTESKLKYWIKFVRSDWFIGFYDVLILPAIVQGLILSLLLIFRKNVNRLPAFFLAALVVALSLQNVKFYYNIILLDNHVSNVGGNPEYNIQGFAFPLSGILFIGPALYFYVRSLTVAEFGFQFRQLLHFLPGIISIIINSLLFFGIAVSENPPVHAFQVKLFSVLSAAENLLAMGLFFYYIFLSIKLMRDHELWVYQHFSAISGRSLRWLKHLVVVLSAVWVIWLFAVIINIFTRDFILTYLSSYPFQIATSIIIFWIGYVGFIHGEIFLIEISFEKRINNMKSTLRKAAETTGEIRNALLKAMESDKLYLTPDLSLAMLSHQLSIPQKNISQTLNNELNKNFHDFVNEYRVNEVKKRLVDPAYDHLTIIAIAMDSGFNSKSSFNRIFMKVTGMSPKEYKERKPA